ncbi:transposase [Streptomyces cinereoruber]|uniref:transposase n=1 Tax=Streptomyces cinereoruber TaxID=67260 RepID=UPI00363C1F24
MFILESTGRKKPRPRGSFTQEFRAEIVGLCRRGDRSVGQVAKDASLTRTAVRDWVKQAGMTQVNATARPAANARNWPRCGGRTAGCRGCRHPQACDGFLRNGDPVNMDPSIKAEKPQVTTEADA